MAFVSLGASTLLGQKVRNNGSTVEGRRLPVNHTMTMRTFISPKPSFSSLDMPERATVMSDYSVETKELLINAAYKHVFGNAYVMESERAELAKAESDFKGNNLSVRELVRAMGKSEAYRKRFFERSGSYGFIELNFKHFMGRGPNSQEEISYHVKLLMNEGYEAEIDSYVDSEEYEDKFGDWTVPRFVFEGQYSRNDNFNRMLIMRNFWDGCSTSTVSGSTSFAKSIPARLTMGHGGYVNGHVGVMRGLPAGSRPTKEPEKLAPVPLNANAPIRMRIKVAENLYQVFEVPPLVTKDVDPEWKKERLATGKKWNGAWY